VLLRKTQRGLSYMSKKVTVKEITDVLHEAGLHANVYKSGGDVIVDAEGLMTAEITVFYLHSQNFLMIPMHRYSPHSYKVERSPL